eukprot:2499289-Pleurochrysis_carterae.AAC.2
MRRNARARACAYTFPVGCFVRTLRVGRHGTGVGVRTRARAEASPRSISHIPPGRPYGEQHAITPKQNGLLAPSLSLTRAAAT